MADDEHVAMLKQGVAAWNAWRHENPGIRPDLRGANRNDADLSRVSRANLSEAFLIHTNLSLSRASAGRTSAGRTSAGRNLPSVRRT